MKLTRLLPLLLLAGLARPAAAQTTPLYQPRDIKAAFAKGTRSPDGRPGPNYWQNRARYDITVQAAPPARDIRGRETITYFNNSPDTLKQVLLRLIQNIHRPGVSRDGDASPDYLTSGLVIDTFRVAGQTQPVQGTGTITGVRLPKALAPHDSVKFAVAWHFPISVESGREGMIDPTTFFLAYFYPRVAVYDDYAGWDRLPFVDSKEFYNDFNDYTLRVQAPANYIVWATGTLQNPKQVLQPAAAKLLAKSMTSDAVLHIATAADLAKKSITAQQPMNTWVWTAKDISDVTFGLSDHYVWDAASVIVDAKAKRRASVQAAYADSTVDFRQSVKNAQYALGWFSNPANWPGVAYPFPKMTAFQGFADMEYPMMVNDSPQKDPKFAQFVQDHEIAHTYFPFYMGINESRYAFMDEGWATTFELLIGRTENGVEAADKLYKQFRVNRWIHDAATAEDLPIITPSSELRAGYGNNAYGKPSLSYFALKDMLGDALFKKALHEYMDRWHGKHPIPWDYFNSMSSASGQDLSWFFNNWFFTNNYIDLAVAASGSTITVQNIGGFAVPFDVNVEYTDGTRETLHQSPAVWQANQKQATITVKKPVKAVKLDGGIFMDANEKDNNWAQQ
ncbi:M1 family metallopeptidase [Hymenobacter siberiensis]|uniref:M1 family metallopeptidase n=1 Tax=Hymenobacter siberiensis TaxID=2848396 RepID=UPI001C1E4B4C|nr:M1 family metallopeptidase [Hymenobacter siberiensis]MBU6120660.1 M1 family metallopeptidase [Hymenobacter siberiensis]